MLASVPGFGVLKQSPTNQNVAYIRCPYLNQSGSWNRYDSVWMKQPIKNSSTNQIIGH